MKLTKFEQDLSVTMSYFLRHGAEKEGLTLDENGFALKEDLLQKIKIQRKFENITMKDIEMIYNNGFEEDQKQRYEMIDDKIRAIYGHSLKNEIIKTPAKLGELPDILYHGTPTSKKDLILSTELKSMDRQKVSLSTNEVTALSVGKRHSKDVTILKIDVKKAFLEGKIKFYKEPNDIWQSEDIPGKYLKV